MKYRILQIILLSVLLVGCFSNGSYIEKVSANYKQTRGYNSLKIIYKGLSKGMQKKEVDRLLGEPDYSPIDGQYYYSSDHYEYSEQQERNVSVGLVVDYRNSDGIVTEKLQEYRLGPIGE